MNNEKITPGTIARTIALIIALINMVLAFFGKDKLPIYESDVVQIVSIGAALVSSIIAWWKNNSFTPEAIQADKTLKELREYESEE